MPQQSINALDRRRHSSNNDGLAKAVTRSTEQTILISDILSEGPIEGLVGGGAGIFLDNDSLQSAEQTAMQPTSNVLGTFTASSNIVGVNPGTSTFNASVGNEGTKYLMVYGVYSTSVTMSDITPPTSTYTFTGNPFDGRSGQEYRIPIGGTTVVTRTAGNFMANNWAHDTSGANNGAALTSVPHPDALFVNLKLSKSGHNLRGGLTNVNSSNQTATFTWGGQLNWKLLMSDADRENGVVHTLQAGIFLKIASISGNTITLAEALPSDWDTGDYKFGITAAILTDAGAGAQRAVVEEKYKNSGWSFNSGTVDQAPLPTIEGVGTTSVSLTVPSATLEKNVPRTITASGAQASEIDEIKILMNYPSGLYYVSERSGREYPGGVAYKVELGIDTGDGDEYTIVDGPGGKVYNNVPVWVHSGLHKSGVSFEMRFSIEDKQPFNGFKVRITRMTQHDPNDGGAVSPGLITQKTRYKSVYPSTISSVIGIIKEKLSYPHTAMANVTFSSKSFDNVPTRSYECQGLKVKIPSNYVTREQNPNNTDRGKVALYTRNSSGTITTVSQLWDGNFSDDLVYTDNPAWVFYDVLTNNRYGLGDYLKAQDIDKYSLYKISKYCDELVPDGKGGTEPRFRANIYLTKATDSYKVLKDMATIFRGILYWTDATFRPVIDQKTEPVYTFSRSNVIDGSFNYETTGSKTRVNQIVVDWSNPESDYKLEPIIVEDRENQIRTGTIKSEKAVAFGCTSEGQAIRYGRWKLWTALNQTEIINFSTSVNAAFLAPGDVVNIQDEADFNIAFSGRVNSCTSSAITIDRAISSDFATGYTYTMAVILPKRTVLLNQDSAVIDDNGGGTSTYTRGDTITHADVAGSTTQLLHATDEDLTRRQIESAVDTSGNLLNLQYISETVVEERTLTTGSTTTADGRDTIPISSAFSVLPTNGDVWAIKQVSTAGETTAASYKQYKILAIAEGAKEVYSIVAAEYSPQKFDSVDSEFLLAGADPLFPPENTEEVPPPRNLRILTTSNPDQSGEEVMVEWDSPLAVGSSGLSTTYERLAEFNVSHTFSNLRIPASPFGGGFVELLGDRVTVPSETRSLKYSGVPDGEHTVTVQTVSGKGRTSKKVSATITIEDVFEGNFPRLGGLVKGGYSTSDVEVITTGSQKGSVKFSVDNYVAAPFQDVNLAKRNTTADESTYALDCTALAHSSWPYQEDGVDLGYLMMDFSLLDASNGSANALRLISRKTDTTTYGRSIAYWYDGIKFVADADSIWTSLGTCTMTQGSRKIVGSGFSSLQIGRVVTVGSSYAAKIALIESNTVMYVDFPWPSATASSQALKGQELLIDFENDFIITPVSYYAAGDSGAGSYALGGQNNTMSFLQITPDLASVGRSVVLQSTLLALSYDADEAQLTTIPSSGIVLTADAIGFSDPEFRFTGDGFDQTTSSIVAENSFTSGTNSSITKTVHANAAAISYSTTPMEFTVTVREKLDPDNIVKTKATNFSINKLKEGSAGKSSALIYLYKMSENIPTSIDDTSFPTVTVSMATGKIIAATGYSISSNQIMDSGGTGTGWYTVVTNTNVTDGVQWISAASVSSTEDTDTIAKGEWTDPIQFSGSEGTAGINSAVAELYQLPANDANTPGTAPGDPNVTLTYTFANGLLTNSANSDATSGTGFESWVKDATSPTATHKYLWKITAPAISAEEADTITPANWSTPILAAQYGSEGDAGNSTALVYLYKNSENVPSDTTDSNLPTVTVTLSGSLNPRDDGTITSAAGSPGLQSGQIGSTGWFTSPQPLSGEEKQYIIAATANSNDATDTISGAEWSSPVQFSGIPGVDGIPGKTVVLEADDYSIIYDADGENPVYKGSTTAANIVLTASASNFTVPWSKFTFAGDAGDWVKMTNNTATQPFYASGSTAPVIPSTYDKDNWPKVVKVEIGEGRDTNGDTEPNVVVTSDSISLVGVKSGAGGVAVVNSNSAHTYSTDKDGKIGGENVVAIPNSSTTLELIVGGVVYTYAGGSGAHNYNAILDANIPNKGWKIFSAVNTSGADVSVGNPTGVASNVVTIGNHTTTANTDTDEIITWTINYRQAGVLKSIKTTQTLTKAVQAPPLNTAVVAIYKRADHDDLANTKPNNGTVYTFDPPGIVFPSGGDNGWVVDGPDASPTSVNKYLHKRTAAAISTTNTDTIDANDWSDSSVVAWYGEEGDRGKQNFVGTLYYGTGIPDTSDPENGIPNSPPSLPSGGAFTFSDKTFTTSTIADGSESIVDKWSFRSPTFTSRDGSNQKLFYYACSVTAIEEDDLDDTSTGGNLVFNNLHIIHSFSGVVAFTDLSTDTNTTIHGNNITTGVIRGIASGGTLNYGDSGDGKFAGANGGTHLDLINGRLRSPNFYIDGGGMGFQGAKLGGTHELITGGSITVGGNITITGGTTQTIEITDGTNVRVKLGKLSS